MAETQPKTAASNPHPTDTRSLKETLSQRQSKELVIALAGPLGCGIKQIKRLLTDELQSAGYEVVDIRLSDQMKTAVCDHDKLKGLKNFYLQIKPIISSGSPNYNSSEMS